MFSPTLESIASRNVITISRDASIKEAIAQMHANNHRDIIVTDGTDYAVLTTAELIKLELGHVDFEMPLASISLLEVPVMYGKEKVINVMASFQRPHEYICVIDDKGALIGIVTNSDIIASIDPRLMLEKTPLSTLFESRSGYPVVDSNDSMSDTVKKLKRSNRDCALVSFGGALGGIITSKDILRYFSAPDRQSVAADYMSSPLQTLPATVSITEALAFVKKKHFKRIVVTAENGALVGIISQKELIAQSYLRWSNLVREHYNEIKAFSALLEEQNRQLVKLATRDRLTGINNRHMFEEQFAKDVAYAERYDVPLHLMLFDIDHFKTINDSFGHVVGDSVLKTFSDIIGKQVRHSDCFARWGGEEFILLVHNISGEDVHTIADKLRRIISEHSFETAGHITCSIGVCEVLPQQTLEENVKRVDMALYEAKRMGRNSVYRCRHPQRGSCSEENRTAPGETPILST